MSSLYKVKVIAINLEKALVKLQVKVIHPDAMIIHKTAGFALLLIDNYKKKGFPLANEVAYQEETDGDTSVSRR